MRKTLGLLALLVLVMAIAIGGYLAYREFSAEPFCPTGIPINNAQNEAERRQLIENTFGSSVDVDRCFGDFIRNG